MVPVDNRSPGGTAAFFCGLLLATGVALGAETVEVQVERDDDAFHIYFEIFLDAPADRVKAVLSDYAHLHELSSGIVRSDVVAGSAGGDATVDITLKPCVWLLCKTMRKTSMAKINAYGAIVYDVIPESSDFKYGREQVIVNKGRAPDQSRVTYNAKLVPKFFVPPLVGSWLIRRHIVQNLEASSVRVEERARQYAP